MPRSWLIVALCCAVLLAGCQGPSQLLGGADAEQSTATPTPTPTASPTPVPSPPSTATPTPTPTDPDGSFDSARFRQVFVSAIDQTRETRGLRPLSVDADRQRVAERIARDLATVSYFRNETAQNDSRFSVATRLSRRGLNCTTDSAGGAFFLKGFYQSYTDNGSAIVYYSTEAELAEAMSTRLLNDSATTNQATLATTVFASEATTHAVGVHRTSDDVVYVVYVVCAS